MSIQEVSREKFDALKLYDHCRAHWPEEHERAWFVDISEQLVGVILQDMATGYWGYSLCRYRDDGQFHRIGVGADLTNAHMARLQLLATMQREFAA